MSDETDVLSVITEIDFSQSSTNTERYFVANKKPSKSQEIELEGYGITCVIIVDSYDIFYNELYSAYKKSTEIKYDKLNFYLNFDIKYLNDSTKNERYLLEGRPLLNKGDNNIIIPEFFICRDIADKILIDINSTNIQFIFGRRISGKSYLLVDLFRNINNRNKYYFDSRESINKDFIVELLKIEDAIFFIDTNVISKQDVLSLVFDEIEKIKKNRINFIIALNSSDKYVLSALPKDHTNIKTYEVSSILTYEDSENKSSENTKLKKALNSLNIPNFNKNETILDNIIRLQRILKDKVSLKINDLDLDVKDKGVIALLILLAMKGKVSSMELTKYSFIEETVELNKNQPLIFENDYRHLLFPTIMDSTGYQIVCNAQIWLLNQMSNISSKPLFFDTIVDAYFYLIQLAKINNYKQKFANRDIEELIRFDTINQIFRTKTGGGAGKLIKSIYMKLQTLLYDSYKFHHQHAICLLWSVETSENRKSDLQSSLQAALIAESTIEEIINNKTNVGKPLKIASEHIQFTLAMIKVKMFYTEKNAITFENAVEQLNKAIMCESNYNSEELQKNVRNLNNDFSISAFIKELISGNFNCYLNYNIKEQVNQIIKKYFEINQNL